MAEYVDLVDSSGKAVKRHVLRADFKEKSKSGSAEYQGMHMQIAIAVVFNSQGQVLVHRRGTPGHTADVRIGTIDHVCGGVASGESPEQTAEREVREETGATVRFLKRVTEGVNPNNFYRYLFVGMTDTLPDKLLQIDLDTLGETTWVGFMTPAELRKARDSGTMQFMNGFFDDLEAAQQELKDTKVETSN